LAPVGVIEAPRVQLENGLFRTKEKPTSLPTAALEYPRRGNVKSFIQGGSAKGRWRTRMIEACALELMEFDSKVSSFEDGALSIYRVMLRAKTATPSERASVAKPLSWWG
jgi:hypothetical protein